METVLTLGELMAAHNALVEDNLEFNNENYFSDYLEEYGATHCADQPGKLYVELGSHETKSGKSIIFEFEVKVVNKNKGWIKISIVIKRGDYDRIDDWQVWNTEDTRIKNVAKEIETYCRGFTGKGSVTIIVVETGPYRGNLLTEDEQDTIEGKIFAFDN